MKRTRVLFYLSTAFLMSCGGATAPEPVELGITQYAPAAGQRVDPAAGIDLAFNAELPESLALPKVRLVGPRGEVAGIFDVDASKRSAHFYPSAPLQPGTHYRVEIDGPKNLVDRGQSPAPVSWEFDTNTLDVTKINQPGPVANTQQQILFNSDGDGILVWELRSGVSSRTSVVYALFDHVGKVWSDARILREDSSRSVVRVAATNSHFLVVWDDINTPMAAIIAGRGEAPPSVSRIFDESSDAPDDTVNQPAPVAARPGGSFFAAARVDEFAVAWALVVYDATTGKYVPKIRLSTIKVGAAELSGWEAPLEIASGGAITRIGLSKNDDAYLVSWIAESGNDIAVHAKLVDLATRALGSDQVVFTDSANRRPATLSFAGSRNAFIAVWDHSDGTIHARVHESGGWTPDQAIGAGVPVSQSVYGVGSAPLATETADGFFVSWSDADAKAVQLRKDGGGIWQASTEQIVAHLACATTKIASIQQTAGRNWITLGQSPRLSETWRILSENGGFGGGGAGGGGGNGFGTHACFDSKPGNIRPVDTVAVFSADAAVGPSSPWSVFASSPDLFVVDTYVASATADNGMLWAWNANSTAASNIFVGDFANTASANSLPTKRFLDHAADVQTAATANGARLALWSQGELGTQVTRAARLLDGKWGGSFSPTFLGGSLTRNEKLVEYDGDVYAFSLGYGIKGFVPKKWDGDATFSAIPAPEMGLQEGCSASTVAAGRQGILVLGNCVQIAGKLLVALLYRNGAWSVKQWPVSESGSYSIVASDRGFLVEREAWSVDGRQRQFAEYNVAENGAGAWSELGEKSTDEAGIYGRFLAANRVDYAMLARRSCYEDSIIADCPATVQFLTADAGTTWSAPMNLPFRGDSVIGLVGFEDRFFVVTREFKRLESQGKELLTLMRVTEIRREGGLVQVGTTVTLQTAAAFFGRDPVSYSGASQVILGWEAASVNGGKKMVSSVMVSRFANGKWEQAKTADVGAGQVFTVAPLPHDAAAVVWARAHLDGETLQSIYQVTAAKVEF